MMTAKALLIIPKRSTHLHSPLSSPLSCQCACACASSKVWISDGHVFKRNFHTSIDMAITCEARTTTIAILVGLGPLTTWELDSYG